MFGTLFSIYFRGENKFFISGLPEFIVLGSSRSGIPEMKVRLRNGLTHEMALEPFSTSPCNFIGELKNVPESSVAVTGCLSKPGDKMHITILSDIDLDSAMFEMDFNGRVTALENPQKHHTGINHSNSFFIVSVTPTS